MAVFLVIAVSSLSNFRQSRQFEKLSRVSGNIRVEVVRNSRRQHVSIFDVVVGDVVCLKIGDQVPADGLFLDGHSLRVDESSMTGESDHVEVNWNSNPFLVSGTKVADGYARMIVTSVGVNTMWGEMMSSISRDETEQTPLQVINEQKDIQRLTSSMTSLPFDFTFAEHVELCIKSPCSDNRLGLTSSPRPLEKLAWPLPSWSSSSS